MTVAYLLKRLGYFILVVWSAATLIFFLPRLASDRSPIMERMGQTAAAAGYLSEGVEEMQKAWEAKFGLDQPLWKQYLYYIRDILRLDFGYSLAYYPAKVLDQIINALPWTIGLFGMATLISFVLGSLGGALLAWPKAPGFLQYLLPFILTLSAVPYYLLGLVLLFLFAFTTGIFPLARGFSIGMVPNFSLSFIMNILYHSVLPGLAMVLAGVGFWALQMRGVMVIGLEENYITFAEAKGLMGKRILFRYAIRNVLLPQVTSLAIALGQVISGAILVEVVFGFPGLGTLLLKAVIGFDYNLISGIVFIIILIIALTTFLLDVIYPLLDPRITYHKGAG
ncbi:MAG: ABC transporter permease [Desulfobacteraceae bacterium]|nr:ABC transporter permease [Desulfobacteraceae bacterium]